jgi:hypothetical protein
MIEDDDDDLYLAARNAELGHHAFGRMLAAKSLAEFTAAAGDFLAATRGAVRSMTGAARRLPGLLQQLSAVERHPLLAVDEQSPPLYLSRLARGSRADLSRGTLLPPLVPSPGDYFFENVDKQPAIALCREYLERVDALVDQTRSALAQVRDTEEIPSSLFTNPI